jgi:hypothetical protein
VWFVVSFDPQRYELSRHRAPDGTMEVVVYSGSFLSIDPYDILRLYTKRGLLSREIALGCVDPEIQRLNTIEAVDARTVHAHLGKGQTVEVTLDERGQPDRTIKAGCSACCAIAIHHREDAVGAVRDTADCDSQGIHRRTVRRSP